MMKERPARFLIFKSKHWHVVTSFNSVDVRQTSGVVSALITIEVLLHCGAMLCAHHTDTEKNYFLNVTQFPKGLVWIYLDCIKYCNHYYLLNMAEEINDLTQCPVCFESYEEDGDHIPRILPCHCTLCQACIGKLLRNNVLECPQDRQKHRAEKGIKTFFTKQVYSLLSP